MKEIDRFPRDAFPVQLLFEADSEGSDRTIGIEAASPWPDPVRRRLEREGLHVDARRLVGSADTLAAALLRWPAEHEGIGQAVARLAGVRFRLERPLRWGRKSFPAGDRTLIMGVLNVTPDSFFDGGRYIDPQAAVARAKEMVAEGADLIDVGGESARPNAEPVPEDVEIARVVPVIEALVQEVDVPISIDTYKASVAEAALKAGATVVNDISGLHFDPRMARVAAEGEATVIVMHIKGKPKTMQDNPVYGDLLSEVRAYLEEGCERALAAGVAEDRIWIDPGIGFGKTVEHNLELLRRLRSLRSLGFPILVGTSNKSLIGNVLGVPVTDRQEGTAATVSVAIANGADGVRIHDVRTMKRVCSMTDAIVRPNKMDR